MRRMLMMGGVYGGVAQPAEEEEGYDNLANWPSSENRPTVPGSTISWIGPEGGGPSTDSDVEQEATLTLRSTSFTTSSNNQVVTNLDFTNDVIVSHTGVTFRGCRFRGGSWVVVSVENTGCTIEDCIIASNGTEYQGISRYTTYTAASGLTVRRCNLSGCENLITSCSNATIIDCWFHASIGPDQDMCEFYGGSSNIDITHCYFDGRDKVSGFLNAGVNVTNFGGTVTNVQIENCAFVSCQNFGVCDDDDQGGGTLSWGIINSGFRNNGDNRRGGTTPSPNSGNFSMGSDTATSGSLLNGTGAL